LSVIRGFLFDLDGTLADTAPGIAAALNLTLVELGLPVQPEERARGWIGGGVDRLLTRALVALAGEAAARTRLDEAITHFYPAYGATLLEGVSVFPGIEECLARLLDEGAALACVTNKPRRFTEPLLEALGLSRRFATLVCGDDLETRKPAPEPVRAALAAIGAEPADAWMIGDSIADVAAARAAGVSSLLVGYGYGADAEARAGADRLCEGSPQLLEVLLAV
jgi:phosphoglycolate phosphatase